MHSLSRFQSIDLSNGYFDNLQKAIGDEQKNSAEKHYGKEKRNAGSINPPLGMFEPDEKIFRYGMNARGVRERWYNISFNMLREIAKRVAVVGSIHTLRSMQLRPFSQIAYNDDDVGFRVKLKDKKAVPSKSQELQMREAEEFILNSGYTNFNGADEREDGMAEVVELMMRELLTIDQLAISLRRNRAGKLLDYWILDGATIKRTMKDVGYLGDKKIKYVQELDAKIVETFTDDDIIFYYMNRVTDIRRRGYGYSFLEMSIDVITAWLYGMTYNKEVFNSSSQPKGILSFEGEKIDQTQLEELQRQWVNMFRGVKGMWKTPFLQYGAKWIPMAPSNRDMEFNQYLQKLESWICALHGVDAQELGMRLNQAQNVLNENQEAKIAYSKDRGLKYCLTGIHAVFNKILSKIPEWKDFVFTFTGVEANDQLSELEVDEKQIKTYMTLNEKRKEKDLEPIKGGDIVMDAVYIQNLQGMQMDMSGGTGGQTEGGQPGEDASGEGDMGDGGSDEQPAFEIDAGDLKEESGKETKKGGSKSKTKDIKKSEDRIIEIIL